MNEMKVLERAMYKLSKMLHYVISKMTDGYVIRQTKNEIFIRQWKRVHFKLMTQTAKKNDPNLSKFLADIGAIANDKKYIQKIANFFVDLSTFKHAETIFLWRKEFYKDITGKEANKEQKEELESVINSRSGFFDYQNIEGPI